MFRNAGNGTRRLGHAKMLLCAELWPRGALLPGEPAGAYEGPWCLRDSLGRSSAERCSFRTFEACRDERSLAGTTAFCSQNPRYLPYWQGRGFGEVPRKVTRKKKVPAALLALTRSEPFRAARDQ